MHTKHYKIESWDKWDYEINRAVLGFKKKYGSYPNILLASDSTFEKIDKVADKANVLNDEKQRPPKMEKIKLEGFNAANKYSLRFCVDSNISSGAFTLVYEPNAEFCKKTVH